MKKVNFSVSGMTCSSCSAHVDRAVRKLSGVKDVNVNLLSNSMIVEFDEKIIREEEISRAVADAGYEATYGIEKMQEKKEEDELSEMKRNLKISFIFLILLMFIAMHKMFFKAINIEIPSIIDSLFGGTKNALFFALTQFVVLIPIVVINKNYFIRGFKNLFNGHPNMDSLIAIGSGSAILYGVYEIIAIGHGIVNNNFELVSKYMSNIYFDSAGMILTLISFGKYLELKSKMKTGDAISKLVNLAPKEAIILRDDVEIKVKSSEVKINDIVIIKPGFSVAVDGVVVEGSSAIDESAITGESIPVSKGIGDKVISGTINKNGYLKIKATSVGADTTLSQIIKLVEEASNSKAPISRLADKVSGIFVPVVIAIAIITFICWLIFVNDFELALNMAISVLVISCPCALGLATPVAIMVGTGRCASEGILVKSAESLEALHLIDTVVLDKTGTITNGKPEVTDIILNLENEYTENKVLKIAGSLEKNSEHPLAEAVINFAREKAVALETINDFESVPGRGVLGKFGDKKYLLGNFAFISEHKIVLDKNKYLYLSEAGKTLLYLCDEKNLIAVIAVKDLIKDSSLLAVDKLKQNGIDVVMLTGDNKVVAKAIADQLGIQKYIAEVLPQDKEKEISKLQNLGKKVAFVGDGVNDSPALARANIGMAIGSGTDIAIESADVILMKDNLQDVVTAIDFGKKIISNIKLSLFWAFFYNCIGIPIAAGVFYSSLGLKLSPMIGAIAMSFSSIFVVTNALRLRFMKSSFESKEIKNKEEEFEMNESVKTVYIDGMNCNHCKMSVEKAIGAIKNVISVEVNLENKSAVVKSSFIVDDAALKVAVEDAGFKVIEIK